MVNGSPVFFRTMTRSIRQVFGILPHRKPAYCRKHQKIRNPCCFDLEGTGNMKIAVCVLLLLISVATIQAAPITGLLWAVSNAVASDAIPANVPATAPDVTFDVNAPLNFNNGSTVANFLNSGGAFNIVGSASAL